VRIVVKERHRNPVHLQLLQDNARELRKKGYDVKTERRTEMGDAITTKKESSMNDDFLFAVDCNTMEVIVSNSLKGTNKIKFIERIKKDDNIMIFNAAVTLKSITAASNFDEKIFELMDNVCQAIYEKHKETKM